MPAKTIWIGQELMDRVEAYGRRCEHIPSFSRAISELLEKLAHGGTSDADRRGSPVLVLAQYALRTCEKFVFTDWVIPL